MAKAIYFDMDGTIANLYGVDNWLPKLRSEDPSPYLDAQPLVNLAELATVLFNLRSKGFTIGVISWLSMNSSEEYKQAVRKAKSEWLKSRFPFVFDEIHLVQYGTPKHLVPKIKKAIIVDDDQRVLDSWLKYGGFTINAKQNILEILRGL